MKLKFKSTDTIDCETEQGFEYDVLAIDAKTFGGLYFFSEMCGPRKAEAKIVAEVWNAVHDGDLGAIARARAKVRAL